MFPSSRRTAHGVPPAANEGLSFSQVKKNVVFRKAGRPFRSYHFHHIQLHLFARFV